MKRIQNNEEILEDAIIKLAAAKYVESEGNKLLEEERLLNQVEDDELTDEEIKRFEKLCDKELKKQKRKAYGKKLWLYRAAVAVAVLLLSLNISIVTVPAMRNMVWEFITDIRKADTAIMSSESDMGAEVDRNKGLNKIFLDKEYGITYLPEGFNIGTEIRSSTGINIDYYGENESTIFFSQELERTTMYIDTENSTVSDIDINGYAALLSVKKDRVSVCWKVGNYFIKVAGSGVGKDEILKMARSVKEIK